MSVMWYQWCKKWVCIRPILQILLRAPKRLGPALYSWAGYRGVVVVGRGCRSVVWRSHHCFFAGDVVLMLASSACDFQHSLGLLWAECEAAVRISTAKSEAMTLGRKLVDCLLRVEPGVAQEKEWVLRVLFAREGGMVKCEIGRSSGGGIAFAYE